MKVIKCELCGSTEIIKEEGIYRCNHCNTRYSVAEAAKLLSDVKIDHSEEYTNYLTLARRAKQENNVINAEKYYEMVLNLEPNNWEAMFYYTYFSSINIHLSDIENAVQKIISSTTSVLKVLNATNNSKNINDIIKDISEDIKTLGLFYFKVSKDQYQECRDRSGSSDEFVDRGITVYGMEVSIGLLIEEYVNSENIVKEIVPDLFECGIGILKDTFVARWDNVITMKVNDLYEGQVSMVAEKIRKYRPSYTYPKLSRKHEINLSENSVTQKEGCYIATSIYGDYDHPKVIILRRFRDNSLKSTLAGKAMISLYYKVSPKLVKIFGSYSIFKIPVKYILDMLCDYIDGQAK